MKIVFTGGGTGGHFFPIIAVAEEINQIIEREKLADVKLYYFSDEPYDEASLYEQHIAFVEIPSGKLHLGGTFKNMGNVFTMIRGIFVALKKLYVIFPDVVFGKGGYASFPTLVAARILGIPVVIHESDSQVGRSNAIVSKWARRIAVSYVESIETFPPTTRHKIAHTGQPVRSDVMYPITEGAREYLKLEPDVPTILVIGGSQGSHTINEVVWESLPDLLYHYQIIHVVGPTHIDHYESLSQSELGEHEFRYRYKPFAFLNALATSMAAGVADLVIARAGSQLFEIALWGVPSIVIPITHSVNNHQMKNAYAYAHTGSCSVIEEKNCTPHVLMIEIDRIIQNQDISAEMKKATETFRTPDAAKIIAEEIFALAQEHL